MYPGILNGEPVTIPAIDRHLLALLVGGTPSGGKSAALNAITAAAVLDSSSIMDGQEFDTGHPDDAVQEPR
jgi:hypothetical protein